MFRSVMVAGLSMLLASGAMAQTPRKGAPKVPPTATGSDSAAAGAATSPAPSTPLGPGPSSDDDGVPVYRSKVNWGAITSIESRGTWVGGRMHPLTDAQLASRRGHIRYLHHWYQHHRHWHQWHHDYASLVGHRRAQ